MKTTRFRNAALLALVLVFMASFLIAHAELLLRPRVGANSRHSSTVILGRESQQLRLGPVIFAPVFPSSVRLVTNDFAYFNHDNSRTLRSPDWIVTSGSLFARNGAGWTGVPDEAKPNADSTRGTGSAIFRIVTRRRDFGTVAISFDLLTQRFLTTARTPARNWDGVHLFLHYRSQHSLYALTLNRRDHSVLLKKKRPGGLANGGTYYTIGPIVRYSPPIGRWQHVLVTVRTHGNGTVTITASIDGQLLLNQTDSGTGARPLGRPGAVGFRGDNTEFEFANFHVRALR